VLVTADGIAVTQGAKKRVIHWSDINRIAAFRQDIYLGMVVCIAIEALDGFTVYISEGDAAYGTLYDALMQALPTILPMGSWFLELSQGRVEVVKLYDRPDMTA